VVDVIGLAAAGGLFGTLIGSFLNVVVHRVPLRRSIVSPPSSCPACGSRIRPVDNIPVVSWLMLRGRCRSCHEPISARYPLVEAVTGVVFAAVLLRFLPSIVGAPSVAAAVGAALALVAFLYLSAISTALALIDLATKRLPNPIVLPAYVVGAVLLTAAALLQGDPAALGRGAIGAVALGGLYLLLALAKPGGMGMGDVKLAGVLGLFLGWLGWTELIVGGMAAFLLGGVVALSLLAARRVSRSSGIPFGPWMLLGAWIAIFAAHPVASAYLRLVGLT
jgi:leader peptidase (prepilin peptidase)/N-methyltransferase